MGIASFRREHFHKYGILFAWSSCRPWWGSRNGVRIKVPMNYARFANTAFILGAVFVIACGGDTKTEQAPESRASDSVDAGVRGAGEGGASDQNPTAVCMDQDGDGYGANCEAGPDCDDSRASANEAQQEQCGDGFDNDCDGQIEEGCGCNEGESIRCYPGPEDTAGIGRCRAGFQICRNGVLGPCDASRVPIDEICNDSDDDCDGKTDEGVRNACGRCGELPDEFCNGEDDDCDGQVDEAVTNACGGCGEPPVEYCDGMDNDCDGRMDEDCRCISSVKESCYEGPAGTAGVAACQSGYWSCVDGVRAVCLEQTLPSNEECNGLDDDCDGKTDEGVDNACGTCGPVPDEDCVVRGVGGRATGNGFDDDCDGTVDEGCQCDERTRQPCYTGLPKTAGKGICRGGFADCVMGVVAINEAADCEGQVLPEDIDGCDNDTDDDCDGKLNEGCPPSDCVAEEETCNEVDDDCDGRVDEQVRGPCGCIVPGAEEVCGNGLDDDCDGRMEEVCGCPKGPAVACYGGPSQTAGVGICKRGVFQCVPGSRIQQGEFSRCVGWVGPTVEICNTKDDDCDGIVDENPADGNACGRCGVAPVEVCDGEDNDCDGLTDERVSNACGTCGDLPSEVCDDVDNDCDGLIDEGTVNHCGLCGQSCLSVVYDDREDWGEGVKVNVSAVEPSPTLPEMYQAEGLPDALGLGEKQGDGKSYLWVAAYQDRQVYRIDTEDCEVTGEFDSYGDSPSRTSVDVSGRVWVGNRSNFRGDASSIRDGNAVLLEANGEIVCRAHVTGSRSGGVAVRALAVDQENNAWVGSWDKRRMYRVSGSEIEPNSEDSEGVPACKILQEVDIGSSAYGAAIDSKGFLWTLQSPTKIDTRDGTIVGRAPTSGPLVRVSRNEDTGALEETVIQDNSSIGIYGIAIDKRDNVWFGTTRPTGYIAMLDGKTHKIKAFEVPGARTRGVAVDLNGNIWAAGGNLYKMSPDGEYLGTFPAAGAFGVAVDAKGKVWGVGSNTAVRLNPDTGREECRVSGLKRLYTYSDMTGMQLKTITLRAGRWTVKIDGNHPDVIWDRVDWSGLFPPGTQADVRVRTAPTALALSGAAWSGRTTESPLVIPPVNLRTGFTPQNQWLQLEIRLTRDDPQMTPALQRVEVHFQRP